MKRHMLQAVIISHVINLRWFMNYRKAFDSVPHRRLIEKLKSFGINGKLLRWLENFLVSRTMKFELRGTFSKLLEVLNGVP